MQFRSLSVEVKNKGLGLECFGTTDNYHRVKETKKNLGPRGGRAFCSVVTLKHRHTPEQFQGYPVDVHVCDAWCYVSLDICWILQRLGNIWSPER